MLIRVSSNLIEVSRRAIQLALVGLFGFVLSSQSSLAQLRYDQEYPAIDYSNAETSDVFTQLMQAIESGEVALSHDDERGYLESLLQALEIDASSQLLVFSKSALKTRFVTPETPRAVYFNDNAYVAYIQNSRSIEVSAMDPNLGSVFFVLSQNPAEPIEGERQLNRCLRCHDSYSLSGGGVPRFLLSSGLAGADGSIVSHEFSTITNTSTPLNRRWGGWYVTGTHGDQEHMGNLIISDLSMLSRLDLSVNGNRSNLSEYVDTSPYLSAGSDIVALLVLEHQVEVQNAMIKVNYGIKTLLDEQGEISAEEVQAITEPLVESLLMTNEISLTASVMGGSGFSEYFQALGPNDSKGRSLRELDLQTRTFKYPLSYQIYSGAFAALPAQAITYIYQRLHEVLSDENQETEYAHLSQETRQAILEILLETKADFASL